MGVTLRTVTCTRCGGQGYETCAACGGAGSRTVSVDERRSCPHCGGGNPSCPVCYGSGSVTDCVTRQELCAMCNGAGRFPCPTCSGNGTVTQPVYEPDPPAVVLDSLRPRVPTDTLPHLSAATAEQMRPDPVKDAVVAAMHEQLEYQGYLDAPIRRQEYEDYVVESHELGMEPVDWREWDRRQKLHEGSHGPHPLEEAGEGLVE